MFSKTKGDAKQKSAVQNGDQEAVEGFPLTERCDACGAHTVAKAMHAKLGTFQFCNHHFNEQRTKLADNGFIFDDRSASLFK